MKVTILSTSVLNIIIREHGHQLIFSSESKKTRKRQHTFLKSIEVIPPVIVVSLLNSKNSLVIKHNL